jgi:hypothetical protein
MAGLLVNHPRDFFSSSPTPMESSSPIVPMVGRGEKVSCAAIALEIGKLGKHVGSLERKNTELKKLVQDMKMEVRKVYKKNEKDLDGMKAQLALVVMARDDGSDIKEESEHELDPVRATSRNGRMNKVSRTMSSRGNPKLILIV